MIPLFISVCLFNYLSFLCIDIYICLLIANFKWRVKPKIQVLSSLTHAENFAKSLFRNFCIFKCVCEIQDNTVLSKWVKWWQCFHFWVNWQSNTQHFSQNSSRPFILCFLHLFVDAWIGKCDTRKRTHLSRLCVCVSKYLFRDYVCF